jgi:hypothetical protein
MRRCRRSSECIWPGCADRHTYHESRLLPGWKNLLNARAILDFTRTMCTPYLYILLFFVLNTVAISAQRVLKVTNRRFQNHGEERRRSITSIFAIVLVKTLLLVLSFPVICAILTHESWDGPLVTRFHLCAKYCVLFRSSWPSCSLNSHTGC